MDDNKEAIPEIRPVPLFPSVRNSLALVWMVLVCLGILVSFMTPFFWIGGAMGLAREGYRGPFFFIEEAFYWSVMLFPLPFMVFTLLSLFLISLGRGKTACVVQLFPFLIPIGLLCMVIMLGG